MERLQENYQIFVLLSVCPSEKPVNRWITWRNISISIICLTLLLIGFTASFIFIQRNYSIDLPNTICACYQIFSTMTGIYLLVATYIKRAEIKAIFNAFQDFFNASKLFSFFFFISKVIC